MAVLDETTRIRWADDVLFRDLAGEAVLVHLDSGTYYGLDEVGTRIWQWIGECGSVGEILARMLEAYDVSDAQAREDLARLVDELSEHALVTVTEPGD